MELLKGEHNDSLLKQVIAYLSNNKSSTNKMSPELQKALKDSEKSFAEGRHSSHDDVMSRMKSKFPELH